MRSPFLLVLAILSPCLLALACPPPRPMPPDAGDGGTVPIVGDASPAWDASPEALAACMHLAELGCTEGRAVDCGYVIDKARALRLTRVDVPCLTAAKTKDGVKACGFVVCR